MGSDDNCNTGLGLSLTITGSESEAHREINKRKYSMVTSLKYDHLSPSDLTLGPISTPSSDDHDRKCSSPDHISVTSFSNSSASAAVVKRDRDVISGEEVETSGSVQMSTRVIIGNIINNNNNNNSTEEDDQDYQGSSRKKLRLTKQQSSLLEDSFKDHSTLNPKQKQELAKRLNLRPRQVEVWFQNRRARTKLKQTEADLEKLKKCCESLTEENKRVHKELKELKSLNLIKDSSPFYMPFATSPPATTTTLTICPSCERIGGSPRSAKPRHHVASATSFATSVNHAC